MSAPLKIKLSPITQRSAKLTLACIAYFLSQIAFFVTNSQALRGKGYKGILSSVLGVLGHHSILTSESAGFSQGLVPLWTSSHYDVMFNNKLCIIRLHFFVLFYCLALCCRTKMTRLILKVVVDLSIFEEKGTQNWSKPSKNNYIATKKPKIRRPFAFSLFQNLCLVVI